ncbi:hypothetical protein FDP41_011164 [Naegleria fowleri]|uniref:Uncharacterized protein n=1 Tax=Naegleria fowleri TaxID=5763 RepID=A0A6A5C610_NAEFO|nr:uncharacterized protein FDP41_011164 [Naegleria fowleri]KAF0983186.1 hypothetical protein FDP41_011164 [Naegleria fowleri]CAG4713460.1 unnamed protein product [Naegleria fowleri]
MNPSSRTNRHDNPSPSLNEVASTEIQNTHPTLTTTMTVATFQHPHDNGYHHNDLEIQSSPLNGNHQHPVPDNQSTSSCNHSHNSEASSPPPPSHPCFLNGHDQEAFPSLQPQQRVFAEEFVEPNTPCETPCTIWLSSFTSLSQLSLNSYIVPQVDCTAKEAFEDEFNRKCKPYKSVNHLSRNLTPSSNNSFLQTTSSSTTTETAMTCASMKGASSLSLDLSTARVVANVLNNALFKRSELQQKKILKQKHSTKRATGDHLTKLVIPPSNVTILNSSNTTSSSTVNDSTILIKQKRY